MNEAQLLEKIKAGKFVQVGQFIAGRVEEKSGIFDGKPYHSKTEILDVLADGRVTIWKRRVELGQVSEVGYPQPLTRIVLEIQPEESRKNPGMYRLGFSYSVLQAAAASGSQKVA